MLSTTEQKLLLKMYIESFKKSHECDHRFTTKELLKFGIYTNRPKLSVALKHLHHHFLIDKMEFDEPDVPYEKDIRLKILRSRRSMIELSFKPGKHKIKLPNGNFFEFEVFDEKDEESEEEGILDKRSPKQIAKERASDIRKRRKQFKNTPRGERLKFMLTEEGMLYGRILMKCELRKREGGVA